MTHTGPVPGKYTTEWKLVIEEDAAFRCGYCASPTVEYREWESDDGAYEDKQYRCNACGRKWWVEGADA